MLRTWLRSGHTTSLLASVTEKELVRDALGGIALQAPLPDTAAAGDPAHEPHETKLGEAVKPCVAPKLALVEADARNWTWRAILGARSFVGSNAFGESSSSASLKLNIKLNPALVLCQLVLLLLPAAIVSPAVCLLTL